MTKKSNFLIKAGPLFLVLFIDGMGLSLLFPILNSIIVDPASNFLAANTGAGMREFLYGLVISVFMLCWFFGAAILGDLSDKIGRKKALLICLLGSFGGYLLSAFAIIIHSLLLLMLGRIIAGFTAGSQPIAQAAIVDISTPEHKARNIGLILLAVSLGFVLGPVFGGILSDSRLIGWFSFATPMYFASIISLLNAFLLLAFFKETLRITENFHIKIHRAIEVFISAFRHQRIKALSVVMLVMLFSWSNYFSFSSMFLFKRYHFTPLLISLYLAGMGLGFSIGCGFLVDITSRRFPLKNNVIVGLLVTAIAILLTVVMHHAVDAWILVVPIGIAMAVAYSTILTMFSNQVSKNEQGWVMGVTGSIMALCFGISTLFMGFVTNVGISIPLVAAVIGLCVSGFLMSFIRVD